MDKERLTIDVNLRTGFNWTDLQFAIKAGWKLTETVPYSSDDVIHVVLEREKAK